MPEAQPVHKWASPDGVFRRQQSTFREFITRDGQFSPEKGRYHLYVCGIRLPMSIKRKLINRVPHLIPGIPCVSLGASDAYSKETQGPRRHHRKIYTLVAL